jgi:hypothetical protein
MVAQRGRDRRRCWPIPTSIARDPRPLRSSSTQAFARLEATQSLAKAEDEWLELELLREELGA